MHTLVIILVILLGFSLIIADLLFIPGGVVALAGVVFIVGALITAWKVLGSTVALWLALSSIILAALLTYISVKLKLWNIFVSKGSENRSEGFVSSQALELDSLIGKTGVAATTLRPGGMVLLDNIKHDAVAEDGFIESGVPVKVIGVTTGQVLVKRI